MTDPTYPNFKDSLEFHKGDYSIIQHGRYSMEELHEREKAWPIHELLLVYHYDICCYYPHHKSIKI